MKLRELRAALLVITGERTHRRTESFTEAQGLLFLCLKYYATNGGWHGFIRNGESA